MSSPAGCGRLRAEPRTPTLAAAGSPLPSSSFPGGTSLPGTAAGSARTSQGPLLISRRGDQTEGVMPESDSYYARAGARGRRGTFSIPTAKTETGSIFTTYIILLVLLVALWLLYSGIVV
ncbi:uncharacterized protein LOC134531291 [Bacillus rossius redtenbacheri]|uniref:uncharacterized protein LOC134531291 n=1 Tax=Bacillus rossius redtenbacheri TaxID=93214 RepID=UPI002FDD2D7E